MHQHVAGVGGESEHDVFDVVGEYAFAPVVYQRHQAAFEDVGAEFVDLAVAEHELSAGVSPRVPERVEKGEEGFDVVRGARGGVHHFDARVVGAESVAPAVMLNQLESEERVRQKPVENRAGDADEAEQNADGVQNPSEDEVEQIIKPLR